MRPQHLFRATKSDRYPSQVVCLECEYTWINNGESRHSLLARLVGWVAVCLNGRNGQYDKEVRREGKTAQEFWAELSRRLKKGGHLLFLSERACFTWTLLGLWQEIEQHRVSLCGSDNRNVFNQSDKKLTHKNVRAVLENPPFVLEFRVRPLQGLVKVLDSANYGLQPSPESTSPSSRAERTAVFVRGMVAALKTNGMGSLKDTAASQSMFSFKRNYLTHLLQVHNNERALNLESDSYYGGRCECFRIGRLHGRFYHLDVTAMYPFLAASNEVPVALAGFVDALPEGDNDLVGGGCGLIADVTVSTEEPAYPYRDIGRGITTWPVGVFRTILAGPELGDALDHGRVVRWHRASWYHMGEALRKYMRCILSMRGRFSGNADLSAYVKRLGVCLVGKFGQRDRKWVDACSNAIVKQWDSWWEERSEGQWNRWRSVSGYTQMELIGSWSYDAIPAIASWVTSLGRTRLLNLVRFAGWENIVYVDTDALIVTELGYLNLLKLSLIRINEPGYLKLVKEIRSLTIHGIKNYQEDGSEVVSGRPINCVGGCAGERRYWQEHSAKGACRERRAPDASRFAIPWRPEAAYKHGQVSLSGQVFPWELSEG